MPVASDRRNADAERHNKRNGHRARRYPARIKCDRPEILWYKKSKDKYNCIKSDQQIGKPDADQNPEHGDDQKNTDANGHRADQHSVRDARHLVCQDLEIRLRYRYDNSQKQAYQKDQPELFGFRYARTDLVTDRRHGGIGTQRKQRHSDNQQCGAKYKRKQQAAWNRRDRKT